MQKQASFCLPERAAPVFPPAAATPLTNEVAETRDAPLLLILGTPTTVPTPLDMLMTGILVIPFAPVTTAPAEPPAVFAIAAGFPAPFTKEATAAFDKLLPPPAALVFFAALITAAWLAAIRSE